MTGVGQRIFILSPASCSGRRAEILMRVQANFELAQRLRNTEGATLGEVFSFVSGLYFRGKLAYASRFARRCDGVPDALIITAGSGLQPPDRRVTVDDLRAFASIPIDLNEPRYREPLESDVERLAKELPKECQVVLLGSIASAKYRDVLGGRLAERLYIPREFVGRGDMSRGGLMLRCVAAGDELEYIPLKGATVHGARPTKLLPAKR